MWVATYYNPRTKKIGNEFFVGSQSDAITNAVYFADNHKLVLLNITRVPD